MSHCHVAFGTHSSSACSPSRAFVPSYLSRTEPPRCLSASSKEQGAPGKDTPPTPNPWRPPACSQSLVGRLWAVEPQGVWLVFVSSSLR